jgi:hypothetical protein
MTSKKNGLLPDTLPPIGISRQEAAAYIGVSATLFDRLVVDGLMPDARMIYGRRVWDVAEVASAFRSLPHRSESVTAPNTGRNPWDDAMTDIRPNRRAAASDDIVAEALARKYSKRTGMRERK